MIRVQNIYYMLAYAFKVLNEQGYRNIGTEEFENSAELLAAILCRGVNVQIKRGLGREYIGKTESIATLRGRINITESIKVQSMLKKQMICTYDEFSINSYVNRIIKTTLLLLLKSDITKNRKKEIKKLLVYFGEVDALDVYLIRWDINYNRNNQTYQMLISICRMIIDGLLQNSKQGNKKLIDFVDEQKMHRLYEKFILEYYRKEHPEIKASASQISWQLDSDSYEMLPAMQTDIMLEQGNKVLFIDAKYYSHSTQVNYGKHVLHSSNMYQIFTYVKNKEVEMNGKPHEVSGMLLYARTDEDVYPENEYIMSGNKISVETLNLDAEFSEIRQQLDSIVDRHFLS